MIHMKTPIEKGERVVVGGFRNHMSRVTDVVWIPHEARWMITLDWGVFGTSRIYHHDEGKIWYRYSSCNLSVSLGPYVLSRHT